MRTITKKIKEENAIGFEGECGRYFFVQDKTKEYIKAKEWSFGISGNWEEDWYLTEFNKHHGKYLCCGVSIPKSKHICDQIVLANDGCLPLSECALCMSNITQHLFRLRTASWSHDKLNRLRKNKGKGHFES
jgi:hypothetical protein